jgi:ureidoglycolate hydrolase
MIKENDIPASILEKGEWTEEGFKPVIKIGEYRLAILRYFSGVSSDNITRIERHNRTDEIFILTEGTAWMILLEGGNDNFETHVFPMRRNIAYNVKAGVWHHVILSEDANIIIFEKADTSKENSEYFKPDPELVKTIQEELNSF